MKDSRLYSIWKTMKQRCENKNDKSFHNYGGRGIAICEEWHDYTTFYKWAIENGHDDNLSIDRIDNDGNYEPSNCRWTTNKEQSRNTRNNVHVVIDGISYVAVELAEEYGIPYATFIKRLRRDGCDSPTLLSRNIKEVSVKL